MVKVKAFLLATGVLLAAFCAAPVESSAGEPTGSRAGGAPENPIDDIVFGRLRDLNITPARICADTVFVRRVYLDVIGTLPTPTETQQFALASDPHKRSKLIEQLLKRDEFAEYWAMKWGDLLRVKSEFPINLWPNAAQAYHHWIRRSVMDNVPYDRFVRDMLTASGSNFRAPPANFYRAVERKDSKTIAKAVALTFMGARAEKWPAQQWDDMATFFSAVGYKSTAEWKEEIVIFDRSSATNLEGKVATFPDGTMVTLSQDRDPRQVFADWLISPKNPWFTRNIANRAWSWLLGRGIIQEPDDIRLDNPPTNPKLLSLLENELIASQYDLKQLFRLILNSKTYQLSALPATDTPQAVTNFAFYPLRRLEAEVLIDAIDQITGGTENYSSATPEPYTFVPENVRSIALPDGGLSSAFLDMFGRSARDTGLESERNNHPAPDQRLHFLNSGHLEKKIDQSRLVENLTQPTKNQREITTAIYLQVLSRYPNEDELKVAGNYFESGKISRREGTEDLTWALMNTTEFLYRH